MKYIVMCLFVSAVFFSSSLTAMMTRIRVEKRLEELKEENNQLNQKVETFILYKKVIVLSSFFSSIILGAQCRSFKAAMVPPLLAFPVLLYAQHTINETRKRQEFIAVPIRDLQQAIKKYDTFNK